MEDFDQMRASHKAFPLDDNSRAILDYLSGFGDASLQFVISPDDKAIHFYRWRYGFVAIMESDRGFEYQWMLGAAAPASSLAEAENLLFAWLGQ